ncbi:MAG: cell division protein FtsQ/DivIB [Alphaproteobacteria bacterium]|nr:cell division protein FtsQ/DivIB [Alphaproteobacteria bacterium]
MGFFRKAGRGAARRRGKVRRHKLKKAVILTGLAALIGGAGGYAWKTSALSRFHTCATAEITALSAAAGFRVDDVLIAGRRRLPQDDLLNAANIQRHAPMFSLDLQKIRADVAALSWVEDARITRRLPDKIIIEITEKTPAALWQHGKTVRLIDSNGAVLDTQDIEAWRQLPLVVGPEAFTAANGLLTLLNAEPAIAKKTESAVHVGARRWDLHLNNGIVARLPEQDTTFALARLARLDKEQGIFEKNIAVIDLRLPDRMVMTPGQGEGKDSI